MMDELQVGAGTPEELTDATDAAPVAPTVNIPLTDGQKLTLRTYQSRLTTLAKQKSEIDVQVAKIEGAMQVDMMKIAMTNNIDPMKFGFNDNLDIIPAQQPGQGGPPPRRA
jgi:hypothetical protein